MHPRLTPHLAHPTRSVEEAEALQMRPACPQVEQCNQAADDDPEAIGGGPPINLMGASIVSAPHGEWEDTATAAAAMDSSNCC